MCLYPYMSLSLCVRVMVRLMLGLVRVRDTERWGFIKKIKKTGNTQR